MLKALLMLAQAALVLSVGPLLLPVPMASAEAPGLVASVLANAPMAAESRCGYTRLSIDEDDSKLERFDPSNVQRPWTLLAVDGQRPSERALRRYGDKVEKRADRHHPLAFDLQDMVQPDSWVLEREADDEAVFSFRLRPDEELNENLMDKIRGTLTVDTHRLQPKRIVIESTAPAYVAPTVRIAAYRQELRFAWDDSVGAAALAEKITHRRGRAMGLRNLRKDKRVVYSDYECAVYAEELPRGMPIEN